MCQLLQEYTLKVPSLAQLLGLIKNLRGVVFWTKQNWVCEVLKWLRRKFQYRNLGIIPSCLPALDQPLKDIIQSKPFVVLPSPAPQLDLWVETLTTVGCSKEAIGVLLTASFYVVPIIAIGKEAFELFAELILFKIDGPTLSDAEAKRHLRILDYAMLDAHGLSADRAKQLLSELRNSGPSVHPQNVLEGLKLLQQQFSSYAQHDAAVRFWRFKQTERQLGGVTVAYATALPLLIRIFQESKDNRSFIAKLGPLIPWLDPLFSLVTLFKIDNTAIEGLG